MKVLAAALCLSLLVAVTLAQAANPAQRPPNPVICGCKQTCYQSCNYIRQFNAFGIFLGPFLDQARNVCNQCCGIVCDLIGSIVFHG